MSDTHTKTPLAPQSRSPWPASYPLTITASLRRIPVKKKSPWKQVALRYRIKVR